MHKLERQGSYFFAYIHDIHNTHTIYAYINKECLWALDLSDARVLRDAPGHLCEGVLRRVPMLQHLNLDGIGFGYIFLYIYIYIYYCLYIYIYIYI